MTDEPVSLFAEGRHTAEGAAIAAGRVLRALLPRLAALGVRTLGDGRPWTVDSDSLVGSATRRLHEELLDVARASAP